MSRKPIYNKARTHRVISGPNATWIVQKYLTRTNFEQTNSREVDHWRTTSNRPLSDRDVAIGMMSKES